MTAGVVDGERAAVGRAERIGTMAILRGAVARLRRGGWRVAVLALPVFGVGLASAPLQKLLGIATTSGPAYWAFLLATAVVGAVLGGLVTRLAIEGPSPRWLRLDRGLGEYVAIQSGIVVVLAGIGVVYGAFAPPQLQQARGGAEATQALMWMTLAMMAAYAVALYAWLRLSLWPVTRLMGRGTSAPRAWLLMLRATRGLVLAYGVAALPFVLLYTGLYVTGGQAAFASTPAWVEQLAVTIWGVLGYGMVATVYDLRVENPATVANVFD